MGQVVLGLRSLAVKLAIFVVMAALLAWALGGTLFPRAEIVDHPPVRFEGDDWWLRESVGGPDPGVVRVQLMRTAGGREIAQPQLHADDSTDWIDAVGPIVVDGTLYVAYLVAGEPWRIAVFENPAPPSRIVQFVDRLAVERQFARVRARLPLQEPEVVEAARATVLEAGD